MGKEGLRTALSKQATWPNALGQEVLGGPRRCGRMRAGPSGVQLLGSKQASPTRDADARMCSPRQVPPVRRGVKEIPWHVHVHFLHPQPLRVSSLAPRTAHRP